jgi:hypothetical protein
MPGAVSPTNSYALVIRDGALARCKALPYFSNFRRFGSSKLVQVQPQHLPNLSIFFLREVGTPWGDANAGEPRFVHEVVLGFSVMLAQNNPDVLENQLDAAFWAVMNGLLGDASFRLMGIEGFSRFQRSHEFGLMGSENETPFGELRLELALALRSDWPPVVVDDLLTIHLTTAYPSPTEAATTQQVVAEYDIT